MAVRTLVLLTLLAGFGVADPVQTLAVEGREVRGRVVDEGGTPVAAVDVSYTWRANGPYYDDNGKPIERSGAAAQKAFWDRVGEMAPLGDKPAKTGRDGRFVLSVRPGFFFVMALDKARKRGGLVFLPRGDKPTEVEIRLAPLIRVKGSLEGPAPGERPSWTYVYTLVPEDPARPLAMPRLVGCGSYEARFEMSLPPGRYFLEAYRFDGENTDRIARIDPPKEILLTRKSPEVDLGVLRLPAYQVTTSGKKNQAKAAGRWSDYINTMARKCPAGTPSMDVA